MHAGQPLDAAAWGGVVATDNDGNFQLYNLEDGLYYLNISWDPKKVPQFLPLEMEASAKRNHWDIALQPMPIFRLKLLLPDGKPLLAGEFAMDYKLQAPGHQAENQATGLSINEPEGVSNIPMYKAGVISQLYIRAPQYGSAFYKTPFEINPRIPYNLTLKLTAGGTIEVRVLEIEQAVPSDTSIPPQAVPVGGASVSTNWFQKDPPYERMQAFNMRREGYETDDQTGLCRNEHLPPGIYLVGPNLEGAEFFGPHYQQIELKDGGTASLTFYVKARHFPALRFQLSDEDGKPAANEWVSVTMVPFAGAQKSGHTYSRFATTDAVGGLTLYPVPAGKYEVVINKMLTAHSFRVLTDATIVEVPPGGATIKLTTKKIVRFDQ